MNTAPRTGFSHRSLLIALCVPTLIGCATEAEKKPAAPDAEVRALLASVEARLDAFRPDPAYKDDAYGIAAIRDAIASLREGSGAVGACLVNEKTGEIVERGRNRQYTPYFRSDLHAEMDLLNRYEDRVKKKGGRGSKNDPRRCDDLVLVSSVEPCPMCLTRIINAGIRKMYYVIDDSTGGMVSRIPALPEFWRMSAEHRDYRKAACSPALQQMSEALFDFSMSKMRKRMLDRHGR